MRVNNMRNVGAMARVASSARESDEPNNRRGVDGSPLGWRTRGAARGAWIELDFDQPHSTEFIGLRNGREEGNTIQKLRILTTDMDGRTAEHFAGPLGAERERLLVPLYGIPIKHIRIEIEAAQHDDRPAALMEVEVWENSPLDSTQNRILNAIRSGSLEISAMYMNFLTQFIPTELLIRSILRSNWTAQQAGTTLKTALITDVPGYSFALPDILAGAGIRY